MAHSRAEFKIQDHQSNFSYLYKYKLFYLKYFINEIRIRQLLIEFFGQSDAPTCRELHESSDQNNQVGSAVIYSDVNKTVWSMFLNPGESFPFHTHQHDYFFYIIDEGKLLPLDEDGKSVGQGEESENGVIDLKKGDLLHFRVEGAFLMSPQVTIPISHGVKNIGNTR